MTEEELKNLIFHPDHEDDLWLEALSYQQINDTKSFNFINEKLVNENINIINEDVDMITLGCSVTAGCGINLDQVWSNQIAKKLNLKNHTIALAGASVQWAISNFFSYVENYKKPKIVLALFPDFLRMEIASRSNIMTPIDYYNQPKGFPKTINNFSNKNKIIRYKFCPAKEYTTLDKYLKFPISAHDYFPRETAFDISIQYIKMLEEYCNSNNIFLIWSTWFPEQEQWLCLNLNRTKFKNYCSVDMRYWHAKKIDNRKEVICDNLIKFYNHKNYKEILSKRENLKLLSMYQETFCDPDSKCNSETLCHIELKNEPNFELANDSTENFRGHFTYHAHIHMAEKFLREMEKNENYPWNK